MSNIGKQQITIPENTEVEISENSITVKGKLGELSLNFDERIKIVQNDNSLVVSRDSDNRKSRELHGLYRALVNNMIIGVSEGFSKELNLVGVGYTAELKGNLVLITENKFT